MSIPYVVSADIELLLRGWAEKSGYTLPSSDFFTDLRHHFTEMFSKIFPEFILLTEQELFQELALIVERTGLVAISLDRTYFLSECRLDVSRLVDDELLDYGWAARDGVPFERQIADLKQSLRKHGEEPSVVLVDDVIFTGKHIVDITRALEAFGIHVREVCAAVGIREGVSRIESNGYMVQCARFFPKVVDEVCERDFYPGVPLSGRTVVGNHNVGAPYILPFGLPGTWASIPEEHQRSISRFCLEQTIRLFEALEIASQKTIRVRDLPRNIHGLPVSQRSFLDELHRLHQFLLY